MNYKISTLNRIFCRVNILKNGCWIFNRRANRYHSVWYHGSWVDAHRLILFCMTGELNKNLHVLHSCDNKDCCNPDHLRFGTHLENMRDMIKKGRARYFHKLTNKAKKEIVTANRGMCSKYAVKYGVSLSTIYNIRWKYFKEVK